MATSEQRRIGSSRINSRVISHHLVTGRVDAMRHRRAAWGKPSRHHLSLLERNSKLALLARTAVLLPRTSAASLNAPPPMTPAPRPRPLSPPQLRISKSHPPLPRPLPLPLSLPHAPPLPTPTQALAPPPLLRPHTPGPRRPAPAPAHQPVPHPGREIRLLILLPRARLPALRVLRLASSVPSSARRRGDQLRRGRSRGAMAAAAAERRAPVRRDVHGGVEGRRAATFAAALGVLVGEVEQARRGLEGEPRR